MHTIKPRAVKARTSIPESRLALAPLMRQRFDSDPPRFPRRLRDTKKPRTTMNPVDQEDWTGPTASDIPVIVRLGPLRRSMVTDVTTTLTDGENASSPPPCESPTRESASVDGPAPTWRRP